MCGGGGGGDGGAAAREAARQATIRANQQLVGSSFGKFDDGYYSGVRQSALDYYTPQLTEDYNKSRRALTLALADAGRLSSSAGARAFKELDDRNAQALLTVSGKADELEREARAGVEQQRANLMSQAAGGISMDPSMVGATIANIKAPAATGMIGNFFTDLIANAKAGMAGNAAAQQYKTGNGLFALDSPQQSVVN